MADLFPGPVVTREVQAIDDDYCVVEVNSLGQPVSVVSRHGSDVVAARAALADYFATKRGQEAQLTETAMVTEINGHLIFTAPAQRVTDLSAYTGRREMAAEYEKAAGNDQLMHLTGRFVEAEKANVNGAFWSTADLDFGELTPIHAPVNFVHRQRHIIGTFTDSRLYKPGRGEAASSRPFLGVNAVVWREFFPYEAKLVEMASDSKRLFWSMECQSRSVRCENAADGSRQGCGKEFPFKLVYEQPAQVCAHLRERSSQRHFIEPRFNAGAVIVPPVRPGWTEAVAEVRKQAEQLAETFSEAASADYDDATLVSLMEQIVAYGRSLV